MGCLGTTQALRTSASKRLIRYDFITCEVTDVMAICNIHTATARKSADTRAQAQVGPGLDTPLAGGAGPCPRVMVWAPKVLPGSHPLARHIWAAVWRLLPQLLPGTHWYHSWVGCFPGTHLYSCADWSNVSKVSCSRKQQQHQSGHSGNRTHNFSISRPISWPLS